MCTRRKKICKHICHNIHGLHLHIRILLRGGKSTCTPNGVAPSCSMTTLTTPECTDDSTPCIDTNAPHESDAQENINIILYDMSITQSLTRTTNESAKLPDHTTTDRHNGRQIAELRWYFHYASPKQGWSKGWKTLGTKLDRECGAHSKPDRSRTPPGTEEVFGWKVPIQSEQDF